MAHRYKVRERPGVRENTRTEVRQAIADLDKQRAQLRLTAAAI